MKRTYIVAELSANHNGRKEVALESIRAAKLAGADAIKIQTYTADTITLKCNKPEFLSQGELWKGTYLYDLYAKAYTPWEWHKDIFDTAKAVGIDCFSTPFDKTAVDLLESLNNPIYKIASFEITDIPLIEYAASKGKPMVISTGVATIEDIQLAIQACHKVGNNDITLLKCTSEYPALIEDANIQTMVDMKNRFGVKVGLSDHTMGDDVVLAAVTLGAELVEKHFIIERSVGGPDCEFSMESLEFKQMVESIRNIEKAIGGVVYPIDVTKIKGRNGCRSLYVAEDMKAGEIITEKNVRSVRPAYGLHPKYLPEILGRKVNQDLEKGTRFSLDFII